MMESVIQKDDDYPFIVTKSETVYVPYAVSNSELFPSPITAMGMDPPMVCTKMC